MRHGRLYGIILSRADTDHPIPEAERGSETSFVPFFDWVRQQELRGAQPLAIYLTDGYGRLPEARPESSVISMVSRGGLESAACPFRQIGRFGG